MSISFKDLVQLYRMSTPITGSDKRVFNITSTKEISLINELVSEDNFNLTYLQVEGRVEIGSHVNLIFGRPSQSFGYFAKSPNDLISRDLTNFNNKSYFKSPYFIISDDIASFDKNIQFVESYEVFKAFLDQLNYMSSYTDDVNNKLIFFRNKSIELSIDVSDKQDEFTNFIKNLDNDSKKLITDFTNWISDEQTSCHIDEKKSILAFVISETGISNLTIFDIMLNISDISKSVQSQYALYLENFSYKKFVNKLEENTEKFVSKINDSINKVLPQFVPLPILTAIPSTLKTADNTIVYISILIYCLIYFIGLFYQKSVLEQIIDEIDRFEMKGKIPANLRDIWLQDKSRMKKLINMQKVFFRIITVSLCFFVIYSLLQLGRLHNQCFWIE